MISYRTLLFGAIIVMAAAAPAGADVLQPQPADVLQPQPADVLQPQPADVLQPQPAFGRQRPARPAYAGSTGFSFMETIVQFEDLLLRIAI